MQVEEEAEEVLEAEEDAMQVEETELEGEDEDTDLYSANNFNAEHNHVSYNVRAHTEQHTPCVSVLGGEAWASYRRLLWMQYCALRVQWLAWGHNCVHSVLIWEHTLLGGGAGQGICLVRVRGGGRGGLTTLMHCQLLSDVLLSFCMQNTSLLNLPTTA